MEVRPLPPFICPKVIDSSVVRHAESDVPELVGADLGAPAEDVADGPGAAPVTVSVTVGGRVVGGGVLVE